MFNLEEAISSWRLQLQGASRLLDSHAEELESHLRDGIDELTSPSLSIEEAFLLASSRLGSVESLASEFRKNEYDYAGFSRRLTACMFDLCFYVLIGVMLTPVFTLPPATALPAITLSKVLFAGYVIGMTYCYGGTVGKFLAGIRVCNADGSAPSLRQALLRNIPWLLILLFELIFYTLLMNEALRPGGPMIYVLIVLSVPVLCTTWMMVSAILLIRNTRCRAPHDYLAGTIVVDETHARININEKFA